MTEFQIRSMQPSDSQAITALMLEDENSFMSTHFLLDAFTVMTQSDLQLTIGLVAEVAGHQGLAGLATASFGQVQFEGQVLPFASLDSWQVSLQFRQQGLASRLVQATIDAARAEFGPDMVLAAGLSTDNHASRATASKWCREFFEPLDAVVARTTTRPPRAAAGIEVREAQPGDYPAIVDQQNRFYQDYNLYTPLSVESLTRILDYSLTDAPMFHYRVAVNAQGDVLAGGLLRRRGLLMVDKVNRLPLPLRLANMALHLLPSDGTIRSLGLNNLWFAPGQVAAARYLWAMLPWQMRDKGSTLVTAYDPRSPLAEVFTRRGLLFRGFHLAYAIYGPVPMSPERFVAAGSQR